MKQFDDVTTPQEMNMLVAFFDLRRFAQFTKALSLPDLFTLLSDYYMLVGNIIEGANGKVVKFEGDAALIVFGEEDVNGGVRALHQLQTEGDAWLKARNITSTHIIKAHLGPVICGLVGTKTDQRFDVFGETVNITATLKSNGLAITPQVFRHLDADTRTLFKKHTPPITYIPTDERHRS